MHFKVMGKRIILKDDVVPHKKLFAAKSPCKRLVDVVSTMVSSSQLTESAKKRKAENLEKLEQPSTSKVKRKLFENLEQTPTKTLPSTCYQSSPSGLFKVEVLQNHVGVQVSPEVKCKYTSTHNLFLTRSVGTETSQTVQLQSLSLSSSNKNIQSSPVSASSISNNSESVTVITTTSSNTWSLETSKLSIIQNESRKVSSIHLIETQSRFYLGLPQKLYNVIKMLTRWVDCPYVDILITLKKIRLNDAYTRLGNDFGISHTSVGKVFKKTVPRVANIFQNFVFLPNTNIIKKLLPISFRYRYSKVVSIIDCFEVEIQKPSNPLTQSLTWSEYKKCNTFKFLISCTPNGFINFVSGAYGGRISDKDIVKESGYVDHLPENVTIMADRGFKHITNILLEKNCVLVRPPSVTEGQKLSKMESKQAKQIAALRIHIERIIRRVREYKMLHMHAVIHNSLEHLMNCIVIIACGLVNLQEPLIK